MEEATNQTTSTASSNVGPLAASLLRRRSGGQALVILAIFMMFLLGLAGIVYDLGLARHEASRAQRAADAAALAGVVFMPEHFFQTSEANATDAAKYTAERHGYVDGQITPKKVPLYESQLEVDVNSVYTTAFMGLFGFRTLPIHVVGIAEYNHPITMGAPEPYLGVGSPLAVTNSGDPNMRMQGFWLSMHSPGTPKANGDPFLVKWDDSRGGGCGCWNPGGPFQPDHDTQGYNFGLLVGDGTDAYLQIYDAAYQPKPGYVGANGVGSYNPTFGVAHPCGDFTKSSPCPPGEPDYNNPSTMWCATNNVETGDNQPGAANGQCDSQAAGATAVYKLYYPDTTPWYFDDDVLASTWTVPASHLTVTNTVNSASYVYSQTWTNFNDAPNPGYRIYPYNNNHQWRLQANVPVDTNHGSVGTAAQNNFSVRLKTNFASTQVYAIQRLPVLATVNAGTSDFYLANVPVANAGKTLVVSLFDPGDATGSNYMRLLAPPDANHPSAYPVFIDTYVHDNHNPPYTDTVNLHVDRLDTTRPAHDTNDKWVDILYQIPLDTNHGGSYQGGYFQIQYVFAGQAQDRTAWRISIRGNPVHIVLGGN